MTDFLAEAKDRFEMATKEQSAVVSERNCVRALAAAAIAIAETKREQPELLIDASLLWAARSALLWLQNLREAGHSDALLACQPKGVGMQYLARHVDKYKAL